MALESANGYQISTSNGAAAHSPSRPMLAFTGPHALDSCSVIDIRKIPLATNLDEELSPLYVNLPFSVEGPYELCHGG